MPNENPSIKVLEIIRRLILFQLNFQGLGLLSKVVLIRFHNPSETGISMFSSLSLNNDSKSSCSINSFVIVLEQIIIYVKSSWPWIIEILKFLQ